MACVAEHPARHHGRRRHGVALIELALAVPLLILLTFAVIEYSWMFSRTGELSNAARHGARLGVRPDATNGQVLARIDDFMESAGMQDSGYEVELSPGNVETLEPGQLLTVTVSVPYANVELVGFPLLPSPEMVRARVAMAKEGPPGG